MIQKQTLIQITISFAILISGCGSHEYSQKEIQMENAKFLGKQGKMHWEKRSNPIDGQKALHFLSLAHKVNSQDQEIAILYSRACYFNARYLVNDDQEKDRLFLKGAAAAKLALLSSVSFQKTYQDTPGDSTEKFTASIGSLQVEDVPALYWWIVNTGSILITKPVVERLKYRVLIESTLFKLLSLDPTYYYGGPFRLLGIFYSRIPGVDLNQSKTYLEQAINSYPGYFSTRTYLSEFYYTKTGEPELFRQNLEEMLEMDPAMIPEVMPENIFEQEIARSLLSQESKLFE